MTCETRQERIIEWLAGELDPAEADRLAKHVQQCDACREVRDWLTRLWHDLGALPSPTPPAGAAAAFRNALPQTPSASPRSMPRWTTRWQAAAVLAALLAGTGLGFTLSQARQPAPPDAATAHAQGELPQFMLLLREATPGVPLPAEQRAAVIREYGEWATQLSSDGRLVSAEKLADEPGLRLTADAAPAPNAVNALELGGFFIVRARDYAEATRLARASPHLKYGGIIDVRAIEPT